MTTPSSARLVLVQADAIVTTMTRARAALAEAKSIGQIKKVIDVAAAAEIYAARQHLGAEAEALALAVKVEAIRQLGAVLRATPKAKGTKNQLRGKNSSGGSKTEPPEESAPTLAELGLSKKDAMVAQALAVMPEAAFEQVRDGAVSVAKAVAAVTAQKKAKADKVAATQKKAAAPAKPALTAKQAEAEQIAQDAHGDFDPLVELEAAHAEIASLTAQIAAMSAADQPAEILKWRKAYDNAVREQSKYMGLCDQSKKHEEFKHKQLMRCGRAIGEADPDKVAAAVEAFVRAHRRVAA